MSFFVPSISIQIEIDMTNILNHQAVAEATAHTAATFTAALTIVTNANSKPLTKTYKLENGEVSKISAGNMVSGVAEQRSFTSATDLATILNNLNTSQAVLYGVTAKPSVKVCTKSAYTELSQDEKAQHVTRSNDHFNWGSNAGVLMLDYDPATGAEPLTQAQFLDCIRGVVPELDSLSYVSGYSSSSFINNGSEAITAEKGQRLYLIIKDASDTERAGKVLFDRLRLAGHASFEISRAGTLLERSVIDSSVWQPSRFDFASKADCIAPINTTRPDFTANDGAVLDTAKVLLGLTQAEQTQLASIVARNRENLRQDIAEIKATYVIEQAAKQLKSQGIENPTAEQQDAAHAAVNRALDTDILRGDFIITLHDKSEVSVLEILDNPIKYHNAVCKDPLEPEYNNFANTAKIYLYGSQPKIHSFAHGSRTFKLVRQAKEMQIIGGGDSETTKNILHALAQQPDVFIFNGSLVRLRGAEIVYFDDVNLGFYLGCVFQFYRLRAKGGEFIKERCNVTPTIVRQVLRDASEEIKPLKAVITAPVITGEDHVIDRLGYDAKTQLYLALDDTPPEVPAMPNAQEITDSLAMIEDIFKDFPFVDAVSKGVLLSAVFTAVVRPVLNTAPAFGFDAPKQGSGKSYLAECLGMLNAGEKPQALPNLNKNEEEIRKRLFSLLLEGRSTILWDNVVGHFDSAAMASFITSEYFSDRVLGKTLMGKKMANRSLLLFTGNNLQFAGDMPRRVLVARLNTNLENPTQRSFNFNPLSYIKNKRQAIVRAALTLIRAYLQSDDAEQGAALYPLAGFDDWDTLCRQPVAWIAKTNANYADPKKCIDDAIVHDPEQDALFDLLTALQEQFGSKFFTAKHVATALEDAFDSELREALEDIVGKNALTSKSIGRVLNFRRERIANGLCIVCKQSGKHAAQYKIESKS